MQSYGQVTRAGRRPNFASRTSSGFADGDDDGDWSTDAGYDGPVTSRFFLRRSRLTKIIALEGTPPVYLILNTRRPGLQRIFVVWHKYSSLNLDTDLYRPSERGGDKNSFRWMAHIMRKSHGNNSSPSCKSTISYYRSKERGHRETRRTASTTKKGQLAES